MQEPQAKAAKSIMGVFLHPKGEACASWVGRSAAKHVTLVVLQQLHYITLPVLQAQTM